MTVKPANYNHQRTEGTSLTGGKGMGYVHAEIELTNYGDMVLSDRGVVLDNEIRRVTARALVDSGAWDLVINEDVQNRLDLPIVGKDNVKLADETLLEVDIVGPVALRFEDRTIFITAVVIPTTPEVLLGAYPLEGLDAFIDPKRQKLLLNPKTPDNPKAYVRQVSSSLSIQ
jgi:clan AA aspartic protease